MVSDQFSSNTDSRSPLKLTDREKQQLDEDGYLVLHDWIEVDLLRKLRQRVEDLFAEEGEQAGAEFKSESGCRRLANLVDKGDIFRTIIAMPRLLEYVRHVLGPEFKLSSLNVRSASPHGGAQPWHCDMAAVADDRGCWVCNSVWMLDDFTPANGALRLIPGSHRWRRLPQLDLTDLFADHPRQVLVTGRAGTLVVVNAHLWHAGTANHTDRPRTALHAFYCRRDKPQQQYQKALLRPEVQHSLSPPLRHLLALDDPLNDQLNAQSTVRSGFLK
jgi:ectoine hydroxylase-related dioxygenase (phytanoyl-CoA dioxygenase family)